MGSPPRDGAQRLRDTERRLAEDVDLWVATAGPDGAPHLVPLSFDWDGEVLLLATSLTTVTGRNLAAGGTVRLGLGHPRDVIMVDAEAEVLDAVTVERAERFAARTGFDPRASGPTYRWFAVRPRRVQAWREVDEMAGRELMREGRWLV
jgi:nitroimidazol reductase NimA-like FMN-containing flavoprotein (pyridoxamine 5'-phosphate oxidase superfamily)